LTKRTQVKLSDQFRPQPLYGMCITVPSNESSLLTPLGRVVSFDGVRLYSWDHQNHCPTKTTSPSTPPSGTSPSEVTFLLLPERSLPLDTFFFFFISIRFERKKFLGLFPLKHHSFLPLFLMEGGVKFLPVLTWSFPDFESPFFLRSLDDWFPFSTCISVASIGFPTPLLG